MLPSGILGLIFAYVGNLRDKSNYAAVHSISICVSSIRNAQEVHGQLSSKQVMIASKVCANAPAMTCVALTHVTCNAAIDLRLLPTQRLWTSDDVLMIRTQISYWKETVSELNTEPAIVLHFPGSRKQYQVRLVRGRPTYIRLFSNHHITSLGFA